MSQKKGNFVIKNSAGSVKLAGLAALVNGAGSASFSDNTNIAVHNDAAGVPRAITKDYNEFSLPFDLTPGIGGDLGSVAAVAAAVDGIRLGDQIIVSGFSHNDINLPDSAKAVITSYTVSQSEGALSKVSVTATRRTDLSGNAIDFTGAWAAI